MISVLGEMNGFPAGHRLSEGEGPFLRGSFNQLQERVEQFGNPPDGFVASDGTSKGQSFFREILGSHGDYSGELSPVVALNISLLALPDGDTPPIAVFDNRELSGSLAVDEFCDRYLLPTAEALRRREKSGISRAYLDPSLRGSRAAYVFFLARLYQAGLIEFVSKPGICEVGAFAVRKNAGGSGWSSTPGRPTSTLMSRPVPVCLAVLA